MALTIENALLTTQVTGHFIQTAPTVKNLREKGFGILLDYRGGRPHKPPDKVVLLMIKKSTDEMTFGVEDVLFPEDEPPFGQRVLDYKQIEVSKTKMQEVYNWKGWLWLEADERANANVDPVGDAIVPGWGAVSTRRKVKKRKRSAAADAENCRSPKLTRQAAEVPEMSLGLEDPTADMKAGSEQDEEKEMERYELESSQEVCEPENWDCELEGLEEDEQGDGESENQEKQRQNNEETDGSSYILAGLSGLEMNCAGDIVHETPPLEDISEIGKSLFAKRTWTSSLGSLLWSSSSLVDLDGEVTGLQAPARTSNFQNPLLSILQFCKPLRTFRSGTHAAVLQTISI
jgi:hypothetical protein